MDNFKTDVKVICCDIDGTLVRDDKSLSEENIKWIHKAVHEAGVHFTLVSGRMVSGVRPFYERMGITGPVSCYNGGTLVDEEGNIVDDHRMPHDIAMALMDIRDEVKVDALIFDGMRWFLETKDCYPYKPKVKIYESDCEVGPFRELLKVFDTNKVIFMSKNDALLDHARQRILETLDHSKITLYRSGDFLEIMAAGYDKGSAIDALARHYDISYSSIMALGDDYNDIPMLEKAGISVAMENAVPEAKAVSRYITDTNNNDGVAKAIKKLVFGIES